ncbi:FtsX-like permease family protein [uncultured Amnibacterium sp.]|uniref:FtsX-like permease family protein n=1 Tax=uncultured Amnibacterium sp. TaxID=1631851 RepID=UPI0035C9EABE
MRLKRSGAAGSGLLLRAIRWRAALSVLVVACAAVVLAGAALGPLFARAAKETALRDLLVASGASTGLHLEGLTGSDTYETMREAQLRVDAGQRVARSAFFPSSVGTLRMASESSAGPGFSGARTEMVWRQNACAEVRLQSGSCPTAAGETMVSARSAASGLGWRLGATIDLNTDPPGQYVSDPPLRLRIVGVYQPIDSESAAWSDGGFFHNGAATDTSPAITDAVFVARSTFRLLPSRSLVRGEVDRPLAVTAVHLADIADLRTDIASYQQVHSDLTPIRATTRLGAVLDEAAIEGSRIDVGTLLVILQLCVLGLLVLFQVLTETIEARSADVALAKLRGFPARALLRFALGEPLALLLAAVPVGLLLAFGANAVLTAAVLRPDTPVTLPWEAIAASAVAFVGGVAAIGLSARRVLSRPVLEQWRRTRTVQRPGRTLLLDLAIIGGGVVAFLALAVLGTDRGGPLVLLGPGLLIVAAGLGGARLLPVLLRPVVPATAGTHRVAMFLAVRQVVRRPAGLRLVALLAVAVGLATFGVAGEAIAVENRDARASAEVGAAQVYRLDVAIGEDPVSAVHRADPDGRWAAAAATWLPDGGGGFTDGSVLAIDARRAPEVLAAARGLPAPADLKQAVLGDAPPPLAVTGRRITAEVTLADLRGAAPQLRFELRDRSGREFGVLSDVLRDGRRGYSASVPCGNGCSLDGVSFVRSIDAFDRVSGTAVVSSITVDGRALEARLTGGTWTAAQFRGQVEDRVRPSSAGLVDRFVSDSGEANGVHYPSTPASVRAATTPRGVTTDRIGGDLGVQDANGLETDLRIVQRAPVLPVVLDRGAVVDVGALQGAVPAFSIDARWSVWLSGSAPADAVRRLQDAGLRLDGGPTSIAGRTRQLAREGPALALLLLAVTAVVGALLAIGGTTVSIGAAVRRRSYEAAALRSLGVPRATVRRAALLEQLLLLGTAVVVGVPAGLLTVLVALPLIPQSSLPTPVPAIALPPVLPVALSTLVLVLLVVLAGFLAASRVMRAGSAGRLRESEE